jgi:murein L,D-transpeptidase YcbB/YkuD
MNSKNTRGSCAGLARITLLGCLLVLCCGACVSPPPAPEQSPAFDERMRDRIEGIRRSGQCVVEGDELAALKLITALYENNGFQPLWSRPGQANALLVAIRDAWREGLNPDDYHYQILSRILESPDTSPVDDVGRELLLSDAFFRLAYHYRFGRVDPEKLFIDWNFERGLDDLSPQALLNQAIEEDRVVETLQDLLPDGPYYRGLRNALATYRDMQTHGGWQQLPEGPLLKPGMSHPQIAMLRQRLAAEGYGETDSGPADTMDPALEAVLVDFQKRHGIDEDGRLGPATREALNTPIRQRIDQIRVNMERLRWVSHSLPEDFLLVDIAGYRVLLFEDYRLIWSSRAVVGRPYRKTPVFRAMMTYLVLNPSWTVPPTILRQDILPKLRQGTAVLQEKHLAIIDNNGRQVDPDSLDLAKLSAGAFPYQLRQPPGPANALGRIKFMFPNRYLVYLHDTPTKSLFDKTQRAFSSGCIRIDKPLELAEILLARNPGWTPQRLQAEIATQRTKTVTLHRPIPILIMYFTAESGEDGQIRFRPDLYDRDAQVLEALNRKLSFTPTIDNPAWTQ